MNTRFLFDTDFSAGSKSRPEMEAREQHVHETARSVDYERGFQDGKEAAEAIQNTTIRSLLEQIVNSIEESHREAENRIAETERRLILLIRDLSTFFASELDPADVLTQPKFGLDTLFQSIRSNADLVLLVSHGDEKAIREKCDEMNLEFKSILADSRIASGQFEITWLNGGIIFDKDRLRDSYSKTADPYLSNPSEQKHENF